MDGTHDRSHSRLGRKASDFEVAAEVVPRPTIFSKTVEALNSSTEVLEAKKRIVVYLLPASEELQVVEIEV